MTNTSRVQKLVEFEHIAAIKQQKTKQPQRLGIMVR